MRIEITKHHAGDRSQGRQILHRAIAAWESLEPRQLLSAATPFPETMPELPAETVLFANYDNGGEGVGYHDVNRKNQGGEYRRKEAVDVERVSDDAPDDLGDAPGTGRGVGHVRAGEWLDYSIDVSTGGTYQLQLRYAAGESGGGTVHLDVDGKNVTGSLDLTSTADWQRWRTLQKEGVSLTSGKHTIRLVADSGHGDIANLYWFRFAPEGSENTGSSANAQSSLDWPSSWTQLQDAPSPRFEAMSHAFRDNLYVFGGFKDSSFHVDRTYARYNPETNDWETLGNLPASMAQTHATPIDDGRFIYFVGGFGGDLRHNQHPTQIASNETWRYDPKWNRWAQLPSLPIAEGAGGAAIVNDEIHFFGGNPADRVTNIGNHYVLDLSDFSGGWSTARSMPDPKDHFSTVALNGKIYTIGGEYGHDQRFDTQQSVYVYEPKKDRWRRLADIPLPIGHAESSTFVSDGRIIFAGGQTTQQQASDRVFAYDPQADEWSELNRLPMPLQGTSVSILDGRVFVALGGQYTVKPLAGVYVGNL